MARPSNAATRGYGIGKRIDSCTANPQAEGFAVVNNQHLQRPYPKKHTHMFDRETDSLYLQLRLEAFIERWHGHRKPWSGIAAEKIEQTQLPKPLAWLYGFAGEWHGKHYCDTLLGNQDCLIPIEELSIYNGKVVFIAENQGVWQIGTDTAGEDPPVLARLDDGPWQLLDESLTRFLVTFVLHETVFGCEHLGGAENVIEQLTAAGMHISPLWLDHPYPAFCENLLARSLTFHVANGTHLIMNNHWCATNEERPWESLPTIFQSKQQSTSTGGIDPYRPIPDYIKVPSFIRQSHLEDLIRRHEAEVEYHQQRCNLYRKMLADMDNKNVH